jgi:hypothetical protein
MTFFPKLFPKKNMKNALMLMHDKLVLRKRAIIETVNDLLKNVCQTDKTTAWTPLGVGSSPMPSS